MTAKELSKIQKSVLKESRSNLSGAVKLWCSLFSKQADIEAVLKASNIDYSRQSVSAISKLAKDKDQTLSICKQVLPAINDTFVKFIVVSKEYFDTTKADQNYKIDSAKFEEMAVLGTAYKPFGLSYPVIYSDTDVPYFLPSVKEDMKTVRAAVKLTSFSVELVCKCVTKWLTHESNQ